MSRGCGKKFVANALGEGQAQTAARRIAHQGHLVGPDACGELPVHGQDEREHVVHVPGRRERVIRRDDTAADRVH